jgi:hypothetical protein
MAVNRDKIIEASINILNRDGIDKFTMRTLAEELHIKAASLYEHIMGKQELYGLIAEYINAKIILSGKISDPKAYLYGQSINFRQELLKIRGSVEICINSPPVTPCRLEVIKNSLYCVSKMGVRDKHCLTVCNMLANYILSFVADEFRFKTTPQDAIAELMAQYGKYTWENVNLDKQFTYGLDLIFSGLEKRIGV